MSRWLCALLLLVVLPRPAHAQIDLAGEWTALFHEDQEHRVPGPALGDYEGLPINDAARLRADSWDASILSAREHQAQPHPSTYSLRGPANIRISKIIDPVTERAIGYEIFGTFGQATRMIWLDGRPHPGLRAPHTWAGFSTGAWDGNMLTVTTTHLKVGWIQRNGVVVSDQATMTEHFFRHGTELTAVTLVDDPVYLEEPFIRSTNFVWNPGQEIGRTQFDIVDEVAGRPKGYVPHYLPGSPGARAKLTEYANQYQLPPDATRGGAVTTYPEYQLTLQQLAAGKAGARPQRTLSRLLTRVQPVPDIEDTVTVTPVQGKVYMLSGAGANITAQIGEEGVLLVDTGAAGLTAKVLAALRTVTDKPIRIIVNTNVHPDHVSGNAPLAKVGEWFGGNAPGNFGLPTTSARVIAQERVLARMSAPTGQVSPTSPDAWPTETFFTDEKELFFNGEAIELVHPPAAHTDGDVLVFFRRSDVVTAADLFTTTSYPVIDGARGGTVQGLLAGLNRMLDIMIPQDKEEAGTYAIPGHGRLTDEADVTEFRDMATIVRDRVQDLVRKGMTLPEIKAARPTADYDKRYGSSDAFIDAIYRDVTARR